MAILSTILFFILLLSQDFFIKKNQKQLKSIYIVSPNSFFSKFLLEKKKILFHNSLEKKIDLCLEFIFLNLNHEISKNQKYIPQVAQIWIQDHILHIIFSKSPYSISMPFIKSKMILNSIYLSIFLSFEKIQEIHFYGIKKNYNVKLNQEPITRKAIFNSKEVKENLNKFIIQILRFSL